MKNVLTSVLFLLAFTACNTLKNIPETSSSAEKFPDDSIDFSSQITWILGYFNPGQLASAPYSSWYNKGLEDYKPDTAMIGKLRTVATDSLSIKVVMGTWCPDSRREVPHFMKIIGLWGFPASKMTFIGVDNEKMSPVGEYEKLGIQRVPTFIIFKNNIEAGRIIENPTTSLEQDIADILTSVNNK